MRPSLAPLALACLAATAPARSVPGDQVELPYEELGRELLADHGYADTERGKLEVDAFLARACVHLPLGLFDVYMPAEAATGGEAAGDLKTLALALLEAQARWLELTASVAQDDRTARADIEALAKWVKTWKDGKVAGAAAGDERDLLVALGAKDNLVESAHRLADYMASGKCLGVEREAEREPLVLVPTRRQFVQFVCLGAWIRPDLTENFWRPDIIDWTNVYADHYKFLALEFAAPGHAPGDLEASWDMDSKSPTGMAQQITQLAMNSLVDNYLGERVPPALAGAIALNLVIDVFGECNTRVDGDLRERRTEAREIFVPGGNPGGGFLPVNSAESRWRSTHGADRFVKVLQTAQKEGGEDAQRGDKLRWFELLDDAQSKRAEVSAPLLGSGANASPPAEPFHGDYTEFLRAYRGCFLYWLQSAADGPPKKSAQTFGELLGALAGPAEEGGLEAAFQRVYDAPLSSAELEDDLEGRFLEWLSKHK